MYVQFISADTAIYVTLAVFITISVFAIGFIVLLFANKAFRNIFFGIEKNNDDDTAKPNKAKKVTSKNAKADVQSSETSKSKNADKADATATTAKRQTRQTKPQATTIATTDKATNKPSTRQAKTQNAIAYDPNGVPTVPLGGITADKAFQEQIAVSDAIDDVGISEYPETLDKIPTVVLGSSPVSTANETATTARTTARKATKQSTTRTATTAKATETKTAEKAVKSQTTKKTTTAKKSNSTKTTSTKK